MLRLTISSEDEAFALDPHYPDFYFPEFDCIVYSYYDSAMKPLYVGKTSRAIDRDWWHSVHSQWYDKACFIGLRYYDNVFEAGVGELYWINRLRPCANKAGMLGGYVKEECLSFNEDSYLSEDGGLIVGDRSYEYLYPIDLWRAGLDGEIQE